MADLKKRLERVRKELMGKQVKKQYDIDHIRSAIAMIDDIFGSTYKEAKEAIEDLRNRLDMLVYELIDAGYDESTMIVAKIRRAMYDAEDMLETLDKIMDTLSMWRRSLTRRVREYEESWARAEEVTGLEE